MMAPRCPKIKKNLLDCSDRVGSRCEAATVRIKEVSLNMLFPHRNYFLQAPPPNLTKKKTKKKLSSAIFAPYLEPHYTSVKEFVKNLSYNSGNRKVQPISK